MNCPCDQRPIIKQATIIAGLESLPRQIAGFPEFRRALLADVRGYHALRDWRAREEDDLGVMLLEMWAYVCDVLSFYDEVIANENYLRTAQLRPSVRKLVDLLGYIPRPAVASSVYLTALAEGRQALTLKEGTAFRSQAFDSEAPQVFELDDETIIHPLNNKWNMPPQRPTTIGLGEASGSAHDFILLQEENVKLKKQDLVVVSTGSSKKVSAVSKRAEITGDDEEKYIQVDLDPALSITSTTQLEDIELHIPTHSGGLWSMGSSPVAVSSSALVLDGIYRQFKAGQTIVVSKGTEYRWYKLDQVKETMMDATTGGEYSAEDEDGDEQTLTIPTFKAPATKLYLDVSLNSSSRKAVSADDWDNDDLGTLIVHYAMVEVGQITRQKETEVSPSSSLVVSPLKGTKLETPLDEKHEPSSFVLQDVNETSVMGNGSIDYSSKALDFQAELWDQSLVPPIKAFGNVLQASRGESVENEVLGSGNASQSHQTFTLKKNPLTYISAPTSDDERGVVSTLTVWVGGIEWTEVSTFYGIEPEDEVYILRQNDAYETQVIFGDGIRGSRPPSGVKNIVASYRFGAGAAVPPANNITQLAKPVKGLTAVNNPFAATGGDDAEDAEGIRDYAPASALVLGRAISLQDFIAITAGLPGVISAQGEWRWNNNKQRPVVQIWFIGTAEVSSINSSLRNLADPSIALSVEEANPDPLTLSFDVEVDDSYVEKDVLKQVRSALLDSDTGILSAERIGIGKVLYRSQLFEFILAIPGTIAVKDITQNEQAFEAIGIKPDPGYYYDIESGALIINGKESFDD